MNMHMVPYMHGYNYQTSNVNILLTYVIKYAIKSCCRMLYTTQLNQFVEFYNTRPNNVIALYKSRNTQLNNGVVLYKLLN